MVPGSGIGVVRWAPEYFFVLFILHTIALWPWHIDTYSSPPGRDEHTRPPHLIPAQTNQKEVQSKFVASYIARVPSPWDHPPSSPVPTLPSLCYFPSSFSLPSSSTGPSSSFLLTMH
jgi:hypothetical protein